MKSQILKAVGGADYEIAEPCPLENAQRHMNSCLTKDPNLSVKVSQPFYFLSINRKDDVAGLKPRSFSGTFG